MKREFDLFSTGLFLSDQPVEESRPATVAGRPDPVFISVGRPFRFGEDHG